jgi:hypothetical protein
MEATVNNTAPTVGCGEQVPVSTDHSTREQAADATYRPDFEPTTRPGTHFHPLDIPERDLVVKPLPPTPLKLFQLFLPESLVEQWAVSTNDPDNAPAATTIEGTRQSQWTPTSAAEIWIWIGIWIYMISHKEFRFEDFWRPKTAKKHRPAHPIIKYMSYNRFFLIKRRLRVDDPDTIHVQVPAPYDKVSDWANVMMAAAMAAIVVGSNVAVDEGMVKFEGRSDQKVTIKTKPTPTGLKVWLLCIQGYIL